MARWDRIKARDKARRRGTESVRSHDTMMAPLLRAQPRKPRPPQLSKEELRAQGAAAIAEWNARKAAEPK
jgi:hypothetical protein